MGSAESAPTVCFCVKPIVVGIGGPTRCGKTTLSKQLLARYEGTKVLHLDRYFKYAEDMPNNGMYPNWEVPESLKWDEFSEALQQTIKEATYFCPDCANRLKKQGKPPKRTIQQPNSLKPLWVFAEGFLLFNKPEIVNLFSKKIYLYIDKETCHKRRMATTRVPEDYFQELLWPSFLLSNQGILDIPSLHILNGMKEKEDISEQAILILDDKVSEIVEEPENRKALAEILATKDKEPLIYDRYTTGSTEITAEM